MADTLLFKVPSAPCLSPTNRGKAKPSENTQNSSKDAPPPYKGLYRGNILKYIKHRGRNKLLKIQEAGRKGNNLIAGDWLLRNVRRNARWNKNIIAMLVMLVLKVVRCWWLRSLKVSLHALLLSSSAAGTCCFKGRRGEHPALAPGLFIIMYHPATLDFCDAAFKREIMQVWLICSSSLSVRCRDPPRLCPTRFVVFFFHRKETRKKLSLKIPLITSFQRA